MVEGSIPVRGTFFAEIILLQYNSGRMIYLRKTSNVTNDVAQEQS